MTKFEVKNELLQDNKPFIPLTDIKYIGWLSVAIIVHVEEGTFKIEEAVADIEVRGRKIIGGIRMRLSKSASRTALRASIG
jgi:hypothetical protein